MKLVQFEREINIMKKYSCPIQVVLISARKKSFNKCGFWIDLKNQIMNNKNLSNTNKNFTRFQTFRFEGFDRILNKFIKYSLSVSKHGLIANALYKFQRNSMYANEILISNIIKKQILNISWILLKIMKGYSIFQK